MDIRNMYREARDTMSHEQAVEKCRRAYTGKSAERFDEIMRECREHHDSGIRTHDDRGREILMPYYPHGADTVTQYVYTMHMQETLFAARHMMPEREYNRKSDVLFRHAGKLVERRVVELGGNRQVTAHDLISAYNASVNAMEEASSHLKN